MDGIASRLKNFLSPRLQRDVAIESLVRYPVGFSWMTYAFTLVEQGTGARPRRDLVLRLAPPVGILPPYRAKPEFDVLAAIDGQGVPIPKPFFYSDNPDDLGAPFLICSKCPGDPLSLMGALPSAGQVPAFTKLAHEFTEILGRLHNIDWRASLGEAMAAGATAANIASRQADHWNRIAESISRPLPLLKLVHRWLLENAPVAPRLAIVHGDCRLGNFLARENIDAILDWELVHIGDPHEDLGWALLSNFNGRSDKLFGVVPREAVFDRYEQVTGLSVQPPSVAYYEILALFKLAVICLSGNHAFFAGNSLDLRLVVLGSNVRMMLKSLAERMERM
jgi:aminoglycoside phosphotransferase (APT) family kinase protein